MFFRPPKLMESFCVNPFSWQPSILRLEQLINVWGAGSARISRPIKLNSQLIRRGWSPAPPNMFSVRNKTIIVNTKDAALVLCWVYVQLMLMALFDCLLLCLSWASVIHAAHISTSWRDSLSIYRTFADYVITAQRIQCKKNSMKTQSLQDNCCK